MDMSILRNIPKVDELLRRPELDSAAIPAVLLNCIRETLGELRVDLINQKRTEVPSVIELTHEVLNRLKAHQESSLRRVINATGIILHTNLGRAVLSDNAIAAIERSSGYTTLEYNTEIGERSTRQSHLEGLLTRLTGAEAALVVNNNAAAVLLMLTALGRDGEVIISRGELVEIGDSFRIPEIMELCGCRLREVGTTNKTHIRDYKHAINSDSRALMKVHTSNYKIVGFVKSVSLSELVELGHASNLPVIEDMGSGSLLDLSSFGIAEEPTVMFDVSMGADLISFSGDKLLGGPQAGIIVGEKKYIDMLKCHQLLRALRVDKITVAALEATLRAYDCGDTRDIPVIAMISATPKELNQRAETLCKMIGRGEIVEIESRIGGGSAPNQTLKSFAVAVTPCGISANELETRLRNHKYPIVCRIIGDRLHFDVRTLCDEDFSEIAAALEGDSR